MIRIRFSKINKRSFLGFIGYINSFNFCTNRNFFTFIKIYPNPATDLVTISYTLNTSNAIVEIYDLSGRSIAQKVLSSSSGTIQLQTNTYQAGIYIVVVKENDTILLQQKLIIE